MTNFVAGERTRFTGTLKRHGTRFRENALPERWLLLVDVVRSDTGKPIAKNIWFRDGKWSRNMKAGQRYAFMARVSQCLSRRQAPGVSGRINQEWRLANPTRVTDVEIPLKSKRLNGKETRTFTVRAKPRRRKPFKSRNIAVRLTGASGGGPIPGRMRQWTG